MSPKPYLVLLSNSRFRTTINFLSATTATSTICGCGVWICLIMILMWALMWFHVRVWCLNLFEHDSCVVLMWALMWFLVNGLRMVLMCVCAFCFCTELCCCICMWVYLITLIGLFIQNSYMIWQFTSTLVGEPLPCYINNKGSIIGHSTDVEGLGCVWVDVTKVLSCDSLGRFLTSCDHLSLVIGSNV